MTLRQNRQGVLRMHQGGLRTGQKCSLSGLFFQMQDQFIEVIDLVATHGHQLLDALIGRFQPGVDANHHVCH